MGMRSTSLLLMSLVGDSRFADRDRWAVWLGGCSDRQITTGELTRSSRTLGEGYTMAEQNRERSIGNMVESKNLFRADVDQSGDWYVWRRLGASGWATLRRCTGREQAFELAKALNQDAPVAAG